LIFNISIFTNLNIKNDGLPVLAWVSNRRVISESIELALHLPAKARVSG